MKSIQMNSADKKTNEHASEVSKKIYISATIIAHDLRNCFQPGRERNG